MIAYKNCGTCGKKKHHERFGSGSNAKCDTCKETRIANDLARLAKQKAIETPDYSRLNSLWLSL